MAKVSAEIIYQDDDLVVINKPHGWLSIPDRFNADKYNVLHFLEQKFDSTYTVHRLDKETSGVMIFARNERSHQHLSLQFQNREVLKKYHCLVNGQVVEEEGQIDVPIWVASNKPTVRIHPKGKAAQTAFQVLERYKGFSLLELQPKTGRMHQIRIHLSHIGHPPAVDPYYGTRNGLFLSEIKPKYRRKEMDERPLIGRTSLHAQSITFKHPTSGEHVTFEASYSKDFAVVLKQLRKFK